MCIRCALAAVLATAIAEMPAPKFVGVDFAKDQPDNASSGKAILTRHQQAEKAPYGNNNPAPPANHQAEAAQETGTADTPVTPRHVRNEINRLLVRQEQQNAKLSAENQQLRAELSAYRDRCDQQDHHIDNLHRELDKARREARNLVETVKILAVN